MPNKIHKNSKVKFSGPLTTPLEYYNLRLAILVSA